MAEVKFKEHKRQDGSLLGEILLNRPKALNTLNGQMISSIKLQLEKWKDRVSLVFLHGEGDKSFCAGGDVKSVYNLISDAREKGEDPGKAVESFFREEYQMDHLMHTYPHPIVTWGHGIVMGGGMGLFSASSHPIVTETSVFAMPEISIGLFPDVGGTYFLNTLPDLMGLFLALTGYRWNATEALFLNLSNLHQPHSKKDKVFQFLLANKFKDKEDLTDKLKKIQKDKMSLENVLQDYQEKIQSLMESEDIKEIALQLKEASFEHERLKKAQETFLKGSPSSAGVICEQLKRGKQMVLKDVFQMELVMVMQCARHFDFFEGVRALLVEKTGNPSWNPKTIEELRDSWIQEHFQAHSGWTNPLKNL